MPELSRRRRYGVLAICCMSLLIVGMDSFIVNVALPSIRASFGASLSGLQWTIDAYTLVLASLLMLAGSTGDRLGRRRTFQAGLTIFTLGSLLCSLAPSLAWLVAARILQAVGGSMLNPVAMSIITNVFTDPRERARAIGVWGGVIGISLGLGPVVGGLLTETIGWRAIFWINIPIGVAAIVLAAMYVPESRAARPRRVDPVGQFLVAGILATLTYAIIEGPGHGWASAEIVGLFALSAAALAALILYEPRRADPLIELGFFRSAPFSGATVIAVVTFSAFSAFLFLNTLYLQDVRHYSPLVAGLCTVPMAAVAFVVAPLSGRMVGRYGPRPSLLVAGVAMAVSGFLMVGLSPQRPLAWLLVAYLIFGLGFGAVNSPITNTAVSGMPREQAGVAAAVASTSRQIGQSLGVAIAGSIVGATVGVVGRGFADATHPAWWLVAASGVAVAALGAATTGRWGRATADRTRMALEPVPVSAAGPVRGGGPARGGGGRGGGG